MNRIINFSQKFSTKQIKIYLLQQVAIVENAILSRLIRVGEQFIKNARSTNTYKDQTGNLRSSIGYVVLKNGEQVASAFPGKGEGATRGRTIAEQLSRNHPRGLVLICVAGMDYALSVETKGLDVITGSSKEAKHELEKSFKELEKKLSKK